MALNIIYGRSGSGKTNFCLERIKKHQDKSIIIVPEQTSLSMERLAVKSLGFLGLNCNVLSFNRLFHTLYKEENSKKREYVSAIGKTLIINRLLTENKENLTVFKNSQKHSAISGQILSTFSEFKRHGVDTKTLEKGLSVLSGKPALKFKDLTLLYEKYTSEIQKFGFDSEDNLNLLASLIYKNASLKDTSIYIDGFSSFTSVELSVIKALCEVTKNVYITLPFSRDNEFLFAPVIATREKLKSLVGENLYNKEVYLKENYKHSDELMFLEKNFYSFSGNTYTKETDDIIILNSDSIYSECDLCGWEIYNLTKNNRYKFSDIAIISSDPSAYNDILCDILEKYDIDYYADTKLSIAKHSLCSFFINLCNTCISNFEKNDIINLLKSGFLGVDFQETVLFEKYLTQTGIKGKQWQKNEDWTYLSDKYDIEKINSIRRKITDTVVTFKNDLTGGTSAVDFCTSTENFCKKIQLTEQVETFSKNLFDDGELYQSALFSSVLETIFECLNQLKICMGTTKITLTKFRDMLSSAFMQSTVGSIPVSSDRVLIGGFEDSRLSEVKVLFVLGATQNALPPSISGTGIITDTERRIFEKNSITLAPDNRKKAMEQPFKMYSLLTVPSQKLYISYPSSYEGGKGNEQAEIISDLKEMFSSITQIFSQQRSLKSLITTPKASISAFAPRDNSAEKEAVKKWFENKYGKYNNFNKVLSAKYYSLSEKISKETANILYKGKINATVSRLEQFAKCPFSFFARYGLSLNENQTSNYEVTDAGTFMHRILECFTSHIIENNIEWESITKEESDRIASLSAETALNEIKAKFPLMDKRQDFFITRMKNAGAETAWTVVRHIQSGKMRPVAVEYKLKDNLTPFEVTTPEGNTLTLYGTVDRIDAFDDKFRIVDYKSSGKSLDLSEVYEGYMLQLFLYSAAIRKKSGEASGMFYLTLSTPEIECKKALTPEAQEEALYLARQMSGFMVGDEKVAEIMDENYEKSKVIKISAKDDILKGDVLTKAEYMLFEKQAVKNATNFGDRILNGEISPSPCIRGMGTSCTYCPFSAVCGFESTNSKFRKSLNLKKDDILEIIKEEFTDE